MERLAEALTTCGYLPVSGDSYSLTAVARSTLVKGGSMQLEAAFLLPRILRTGNPVDPYDLMES